MDFLKNKFVQIGIAAAVVFVGGSFIGLTLTVKAVIFAVVGAVIYFVNK